MRQAIASKSKAQTVSVNGLSAASISSIMLLVQEFFTTCVGGTTTIAPSSQSVLYEDNVEQPESLLKSVSFNVKNLDKSKTIKVHIEESKAAATAAQTAPEN